MILKKCNPLGIWFRERDHKYISKYNANHISVTTLLSKYSKPFPEDGHIKYARKHELDPNYVEQCWNEQKRLGTELGSWLHLQLEYRLQNKIPDLSYLITKERDTHLDLLKQRYIKNYRVQMKNFINYAQQFNYLASEVIVGNKTLAGQIDCLTKECILDFKNDKEVAIENKYYSQYKNDWVHVKMLPPLQHLDACAWNKYCLQINLYHYLLPDEIKRGFTQAHKVIKFDRYSQNYQVLEIPNMQQEIKLLINDIN